MARACARLTVFDISPTLRVYENTDMALARAFYHWFFLIQPAPMPERMIGSDGPGTTCWGASDAARPA